MKRLFVLTVLVFLMMPLAAQAQVLAAQTDFNMYVWERGLTPRFGVWIDAPLDADYHARHPMWPRSLAATTAAVAWRGDKFVTYGGIGAGAFTLDTAAYIATAGVEWWGAQFFGDITAVGSSNRDHDEPTKNRLWIGGDANLNLGGSGWFLGAVGSYLVRDGDKRVQYAYPEGDVVIRDADTGEPLNKNRAYPATFIGHERVTAGFQFGHTKYGDRWYYRRQIWIRGEVVFPLAADGYLPKDPLDGEAEERQLQREMLNPERDRSSAAYGMITVGWQGDFTFIQK